MRIRTLVLTTLLLVTATAALSQESSRLSDITAAIAAGDGSAGRLAAITKYLDASGVSYQKPEFVDSRMRRGTNVVATINTGSAATKTLLLGAHYDRVAVGQGVVDNGASCAVLIHLLEAFKASPLQNYSVKLAFFDLEEGGLGGSRAYFENLRATNGPLPSYAVNLDIFGYGDTFFAAASRPEGVLATALQRGGFPLRLVPPTQYPTSDHNSMIAAGVETLGIAMIDSKEIEGILNMGPSTAPPRILTLIHTPRDTMEVFRGEDVARGAAAMEQFIRLLDRE